MKSIENSIEGEHLFPKSLLTDEINKEMAGCDLVSTDNENTKGKHCEHLKFRADQEAVHNNLSTRKQESMSSSNGYLEDIVSDDDFELRVEASPDGCESLKKKVDEDTISAPQIVQEIKDILGIQNGIIETEYDLEEKDSPTVNCLEPDEVVEVDKDAKNISMIIDLVGDTNPEQQNTKCKTKEGESQEETCQSNNLLQKSLNIIGISRSNVPPSVNSVIEPMLCESPESKSVVSVTNKSFLTGGNIGEVSNKEIFSDCENNTGYNDDNTIALSQSSNLSEGSVEWTVIDSVETSDEEKSDQLKQITPTDVNPMLENKLDQMNLSNGAIDLPLKENCEGSRKRVACNNVSNELFKKPKLNAIEQNSLEVKSVKRPLPMIEMNEVKRVKSNVGIEQPSEEIVDSSENNCSIEDLKKDKVNHLDSKANDKFLLSEHLVCEDVFLHHCDIAEPLENNCLKNEEVTSEKDRDVSRSIQKHHAKESSKVILKNSLILPQIFQNNKEIKETNMEINEGLPNESIEKQEKSVYHQENKLCDLSSSGQSDVQQKPLISEKSNCLNAESAIVELIENDEISAIGQGNKSDTPFKVSNDDPQLALKCDNSSSSYNKHSDSDLREKQEITKIDQESKICVDKVCNVQTQIFNDQDNHTPNSDISKGRHGCSADIKFIKLKELSLLDQKLKSDQGDSVCIRSQSSNLETNKEKKPGGNLNELTSSPIMISKGKISLLDQKDISCEIQPQNINNENQEQSLKDGKADTKANDIATYELSKIKGSLKLEEDNSFKMTSDLTPTTETETSNVDKVVTIKDENSCRIPPPDLTMKQNLCTSNGNETAQACVTLPNDVVIEEQKLSESDKTIPVQDISFHLMKEKQSVKSLSHSLIDCNKQETMPEEDSSSHLINKRKLELKEKSPELLLHTSNNNEKQSVAVKEDNLDGVLSNTNSNKENSLNLGVGLSTSDLNKDNDETNQYLSREIQSLAKKIELHETNSHVSKSNSSPFQIIDKFFQKNLKPKSTSNLDLAIESVVEKCKRNAEKDAPILAKFHKDKLKKMTRVDLEEAVVLKVCEAITDRSELGQLRLRVQKLEQNNEIWRKKAIQFEKQNRELEMVLKRFLTESAQIKRDNQNKVPLPIKVTRSVGLQVVLASSVNGSLASSKTKHNLDSNKNENKRFQSNQPQQRQPQMLLPKRPEKEPVKDLQKRVPFVSPPVRAQSSVNNPMSSRDRLKQIKSSPSPGASTSSRTNLQANSSAPSTPQPSPHKTSNQKTLSTLTPIKKKSTPMKDMEVIDLTDKEDKNKGLPHSQSVGPSIRVNPSTQVCFVQQSPASTPAQPMYALVQKPGRQQFLVATTSASSPLGGLQSRPVVGGVTPRPTNTLTALPVFRAGGGQIIPVQTSPAVRPNHLGNTQVRQVPQAIRIQSQIKVLKHPAPLPSVPPPVARPGTKAPPPKPTLKIAKTGNGIMLSWSMSLTKDLADMASYQLYAYQEASQPPSTNLWKKVGDVKALPLPMACTLTQFIDGHKYHFAVRAVDIHGRIGPFSHPGSILLTK